MTILCGEISAFMETFFFVYFHKDDIVPDLADTFPGNDIFIITSEQAAESSGAWKYKGGEKVIEHYEKADYCSRDIYENDKRIKECVDFIVSEKMLALGHKENLERLHHELVSKDWFMTLLDFNDYVEKKDQALADYADRKT